MSEGLPLCACGCGERCHRTHTYRKGVKVAVRFASRGCWMRLQVKTLPREYFVAAGRKGGLTGAVKRGRNEKSADWRAGYSAGWHASKRSWLNKIHALQAEIDRLQGMKAKRVAA